MQGHTDFVVLCFREGLGRLDMHEHITSHLHDQTRWPENKGVWGTKRPVSSLPSALLLSHSERPFLPLVTSWIYFSVLTYLPGTKEEARGPANRLCLIDSSCEEVSVGTVNSCVASPLHQQAFSNSRPAFTAWWRLGLCDTAVVLKVCFIRAQNSNPASERINTE